MKPPKTRNGIRDVPIPATLLPLFKRMMAGKPDGDKLVPILEVTGKEHTASMMRAHLKLAGVTHARLTADTATHMPVGFRSWRDTGITWLALSNVDVGKMQRRAGHDTLETTMGYVKAAEDLSGAAGTPFPELPEELIRPTIWTKWAKMRGERGCSVVPAQGFERRSSVPTLDNIEESVASEEPKASESVKKGVGPDHIGPTIGPASGGVATAPDAVEMALAAALRGASAAGQWAVVAQLATELEARRRARAGDVVSLAGRNP